MRFLYNFDATAVRSQHPKGNLQSPAGCVKDRDRSISPLRPAKNLKSSAAERMERVEDLDVRAFCAQGIVRVGALTLTSTVSSPLEDYLRMGNDGGPPARSSSFCR